MRKVASDLLILMALGLFAIALAFQIYLPTTAQAKPLAGFTPTPTTPDGGGGGGGGGGGNTGDDKDDDSDPPGFIIIQIESCDLTCSVAETDSAATEPLSALASTVAFLPTAPAPELLAQVRLVHQGSGFIVEGTISNQQSTRFSVPYPGQWEVYLNGQPQWSPGPPDLSGGLTYLSEAQSLGLVEANNLAPQFVRCPADCASPAAPPAVPQALPTTGAETPDTISLAKGLLMAGLSLTIVGLTFLLAVRMEKSK